MFSGGWGEVAPLLEMDETGEDGKGKEKKHESVFSPYSGYARFIRTAMADVRTEYCILHR